MRTEYEKYDKHLSQQDKAKFRDDYERALKWLNASKFAEPDTIIDREKNLHNQFEKMM